MRAMVLTAPGEPLQIQERDDPVPGRSAVRIGVSACGECRTEGKHLGIYGFGAAGHIIARVARWQGRSVHAFTRAGDIEAQRLAISLGVDWAGESEGPPPVPLDVAAPAEIKTHTTAFPLRRANEVLSRLRSCQITGAAVLQP